MSIEIFEKISQKNRKRIQLFLDRLLAKAPIDAVIVFGSLAKQQEGWGSDIDILIISDSFGTNWFERHSKVYSLSEGGIDIFLYTHSEIQEMFQYRHALLLEALADGLILYDPKEIAHNLKNQVQNLQAKGQLKRVTNGWQIIN